MNALPALLFSGKALMQWEGFKAQQVRHGVCQCGAAKRQGARQPGPSCPETLAKQLVRLNLRELESVFNSAIRALARAGVFEAQGHRHHGWYRSGDHGAPYGVVR